MEENSELAFESSLLSAFIQVKNFLYQSLCFLLIALGMVLLLGKEHFLLGSALGALEWPMVFWGSVILFFRRKKGLTQIDKVLVLTTGLLFLHGMYGRISRITFPSGKNTEQEVSIMTYNLFFKNAYKSQILKEIKAHPVDIMAVQELTPAWSAQLGSITADYPYRSRKALRGTHGLGLYSRYPILSTHFLKNSRGRPFAQVCQIKIGNKDLIVANAHLASPAVAVENPDNFLSLYASNYEERKSQIQLLVDYLETHHQDKPRIIMGDLNTMRIEALYRRLRQGYSDLYRKKGMGPGWNFPNIASIPFPLITLDYMLYRGKIRGLDAEVLPGSSSDHLALWGRIRL